MEPELEVVLTEIASKTNIKNPKFISTYQAGKGEGYIGRVKLLNIIESETDEKKLSVAVKQSPLNPHMHADIPISTFFQTEILFYSKITKALEDLQSEFAVKCTNFTKCYYTDNTPMREILVMEDLIPKGYQVINREIPMQFAHMKLAFEELARLHALCFALKALKPELNQELMEPLLKKITFRDIYISVGFGEFTERASADFRTLLMGTKYYDTYCNFADRIVEEFDKSSEMDEYSIFCHGDAWCNNMMFTHDTHGNPTSVRYIDYQLSRIHSPAADLSYLFYGCADIELIPKLNDFLEYYHTTMRDTLALFGLDAEQIYPWTKLLEHWKSFGKMGFITSFLMRVIMLSTPDEAPDVGDSVNQGKPIMEAAYYYKLKRQEEYNQTVLAIIKHFIDKYL